MEVLGRDPRAEATRVAVGTGTSRLVGLVPDTLITEGRRLTGGHGHQTLYEWIAAHARAIETTLRALREGRRVASPLNRIRLERE
ncbi:MAG: hypothetical protein AAFR35_05955 [Pseudomonadota bacterium]